MFLFLEEEKEENVWIRKMGRRKMKTWKWIFLEGRRKTYKEKEENISRGNILFCGGGDELGRTIFGEGQYFFCGGKKHGKGKYFLRRRRKRG